MCLNLWYPWQQNHRFTHHHQFRQRDDDRPMYPQIVPHRWLYRSELNWSCNFNNPRNILLGERKHTHTRYEYSPTAIYALGFVSLSLGTCHTFMELNWIECVPQIQTRTDGNSHNIYYIGGVNIVPRARQKNSPEIFMPFSQYFHFKLFHFWTSLGIV